MADLSSYTHKWRATTNGNHADASKVNKRNRQPTSCQACRNRKLKCDKGHPCEGCAKRGEEASCRYGKLPVSQPARKEVPKPSTSKTQDRLRQLEDLVRQLAKPADDGQQPLSLARDGGMDEGPLNRDRHATNYTGSTHWSAVLDQIQDLKSSLLRDSPIDEPVAAEDETRPSTIAIFGAAQPPPLPVLLESYLPPRKQVDRYLSTYFNAQYLIVPFVHTSQFQRQYEEFWQDQTSKSPIWVSLLFSIICIADIVRKASPTNANSPQDNPMPKDHFLSAAAQCLVLGDYTRPQPHLVEALSFHTQCKYTMSLDPCRELGLIMSIIVRQAYTMGYHRDPSKFPDQFTPFEGEQRRRVWSALKQFDLMASFQLGIPQSIAPDSADTLEPRNILDCDFDENTKVLPADRPDTEPTSMLYFVVKGRVMGIFSKVVRHSLSFPSKPPTNADIMDLHAEIQSASNTIPIVLSARPMSLSYSDPSYLIMLRTNLLFLVQKSFCVLHRKYMASSGPGSSYSRKVCLEACTILINHFIDLHGEFAPGGQLYQDRWMLTSFTINDFLLVSMLLCLTLWQSQKSYVRKDGRNLLDQDGEARGHFELLVKAQTICAEYGRRSVETRHVAEVLSNALGKIRQANGGNVDKRDSSTPGDIRNYHLNMTGGTLANSSPRVEAVENDNQLLPDLTPLSMNSQSNGSGLSTSSAAGLTSTNHYTQASSTTTDSVPTSMDDSALWTINSASAIKPNNPFLVPQTATETTNINLQFDSVSSPFAGMLSANAQDIDWASFDQFLTSAFDPNQMDGIEFGDSYDNVNRSLEYGHVDDSGLGDGAMDTAAVIGSGGLTSYLGEMKT